MKTLAFVRPDIVKRGETVPVMIDEVESYMHSSMLETKFECSQPEELDDEDFNLILTLNDGTKIKAMSIDFEWSVLY